MKKIRELHEINDLEKYNKLIVSMQSNGFDRPILVVDMGDYYQALTGSHRLAAAKHIGIEIPIQIIGVDLFETICSDCKWGIDMFMGIGMVMRDLEGFCKDLERYNMELADLLIKG